MTNGTDKHGAEKIELSETDDDDDNQVPNINATEANFSPPPPPPPKISVATNRLLSLYNLCESQRQMHRLSYDHLRFLDFWTNTFVLTVITMISGLLAFLATSDLTTPTPRSKEVLSAIVGSVSVLSVAIQKIAKIANFGSRADMHGQVAIGMKKLCDQIESDLTEDPDEIGGLVKTTQGDNEESTTKKTIQTYREMYHMCLDACNSTIPLKIQQAFSLVDKRFSLNFLSESAIEKMSTSFGGNSTVAKMTLYAVMYNELYCEFSRRSTWLCALPDPQKRYEAALQTVEALYKNRDEFFNV